MLRAPLPAEPRSQLGYGYAGKRRCVCLSSVVSGHAAKRKTADEQWLNQTILGGRCRRIRWVWGIILSQELPVDWRVRALVGIRSWAFPPLCCQLAKGQAVPFTPLYPQKTSRVLSLQVRLSGTPVLQWLLTIVELLRSTQLSKGSR